MPGFLAFFVLVTALREVVAYDLHSRQNFPFEQTQLTDEDVIGKPDISFGTFPGEIKARCKSFPGDRDWPNVERWNAFNASLAGALIKGVPPAAACYSGPYQDSTKCAAARQGSRSSNFVKEDPLIPFGQWQLGNPCPIPSAASTPPQALCNISSFPAYVVNASTVKHIQLAVNFARNNNIRITVKNTGHDFLGRNTGGGALQIWVHRLKAFEFLPEVSIGEYSGKAAKVGAALEQYELFPPMEQNNITLLAPGSSTVGAFGGYMQGGGFSYITSKFGLMADQVLSLQVVTPDGRFVHADPEENEDLFWAIRGGGPGNFGIVTSAIIKAHDPITVSRVTFNFQTSGTNSVSNNVFWKGISTYFSHLARVIDSKGIGWNNVNTQSSNTAPNNSRIFTFTGQFIIPNMPASQFKDFIMPVAQELSNLGIKTAASPTLEFWETYPKYSFRPSGPGEGVSNGRFASRLFPRSSFVDAKSEEFVAIMASIRTWVETGGYGFHSVDYHPSLETAGYPGAHSAVNPHLRKAAMHATGFDTASYGPESTPEDMIKSHKRLSEFADRWRAASPGSGAYMNEADTEEPNFQSSFYGSNYDRLLKIKNERDPWGALYVVTGVGSDQWKVEGTSGLPTQQGRLCRV